MAYSNGKCAVVTGAGSGIGRALALQLNREGCALYLSDINEETLAETAAMLERQDLSCDTQRLDVSDRAAFHGWADRVASERDSVDIVINNAGVGLGETVEDMSYENLDWMMGINFWGVVHGTKAFLPLLRKSQQGHLINISSIFGIIAVPTQSAYNSAKFAVRGFTEALRHELKGSTIHVCCVHPGGIETNIARDSRGGDSTAEERDAQFKQHTRTTAEGAAAQIITALEKKKARLLIGNDAKIVSLIARLFPTRYAQVLKLDKLMEGL